MKWKGILAMALITTLFGCKQDKPAEVNTTSNLMMDSLYQGDKTVTLVQKQDDLALGEEFKNFEDNPNISQADLDAINHIPAKNIQYVNKGDEIVLKEKQEGQ
jgi:hypothetical protein